MKITAIINPQKITVNAKPAAEHISVKNQIIREYVGADPYEGDYTITPGREAIVLNTIHKRMTDNLTINPIPSNYGLITWNGATLTIS